MQPFKIYMSVEEGFEKNRVPYRSSNKIARAIQERGHDLHLVKPKGYDLDALTVEASYQFRNVMEDELLKKTGRHTPEGDLFIIYGDETSKSPGLDFGLMQYEFLRQLESTGLIGRFFNRPDAEAKTIKPWLAEQYAKGALDGLPVAATYTPISLDEVRHLLTEHHELVLKPSFGCRSTGVRKIRDVSELSDGEQNNLRDIVLQEVIESKGVEGRIAVLDGNILFTTKYFNFSAPWEKQTEYDAKESEFSSEQIEASLTLLGITGLDFGGVDWIGDKINEINGTGTGVIGRNAKGETTYDYSYRIVDFAERLAGGGT
jgi:glutathione synthase/RimK-type ligase-like ATP-grasp enzyme